MDVAQDLNEVQRVVAPVVVVFSAAVNQVAQPLKGRPGNQPIIRRQDVVSQGPATQSPGEVESLHIPAQGQHDHLDRGRKVPAPLISLVVFRAAPA